MSVNYMQVGRSASFTFTKSGRKVHLFLDGNLENKTICGIQLDELSYPLQKMCQYPNLCISCDTKWKALVAEWK